jgi:epoxyqueuosine reductase
VYEGFESTCPTSSSSATPWTTPASRVVPSSAEDPEGQLEVCDQYNRGARVVNWLAHWIRAQGYEAKPHAGPWVGSLNLLPAAIACGFGELGKHGSLINREYGSSFRLAAVETDLPLLFDAPDAASAPTTFCAGCQVCANECPPDAISRDKQLVRGTLKWAVDFDRCIPYFNETYGCGICVAVCPWSTPGARRSWPNASARRAATSAPPRRKPRRRHDALAPHLAAPVPLVAHHHQRRPNALHRPALKPRSPRSRV